MKKGITEISLLQIEREKITKQIKEVKEERKYLETIRNELISKQYHACDSWKEKYFETKEVTASLEEVLTKHREDLELYYKKVLLQLEAREVNMKPKNTANTTDSKNSLIIQITEVQHEIDQLKKKLVIEKMKHIIEAKMRRQAISDVGILKAELTE
ncbi:spermatogenesis-associated protein 1 isoform X1 [Pipistrellus kuhlii]|uniref:spermatogenesis-associated protein 1 isoform X1 n=1 Tax=Pipistrellus kuhlii TaxID=59472 RepID=UPI001E27334F|nr:spermatogenesis-associated protein 1 isoform X1 [Pipistrellus kuhlii]XP_045440354.1 spermatogenesis-associated protein 1 isoform X1 [Pipistrellus kuhlii]